MARLYANENFPRRVVEGLRDLGHDILTTLEAGNANQGTADDQVLNFAIQSQRSVLTLNRKDFIRLHLQNSSHCGIVVCTQDDNVQRQVQRVNSALVAIPNLMGKLVRVSRM